MTTTWNPLPGSPRGAADDETDDVLPAWARAPRPGVHARLRRTAQAGLAVAAALAVAAVLWPPVLPAVGPPSTDLVGDGVEAVPDAHAVATAYLGSWAAPALAARAVATLLVGLWLVRIASGPQVDRTELRRSPGWGVGAWLVPVVSLWWPMQVLRDLWWATVPAGRRPDRGIPGARPTPVLVGAWWSVWATADVAALVARWAVRRATGAEDLERWVVLDRVASGLWAVAALALLVLLHRLGRRVGTLYRW